MKREQTHVFEPHEGTVDLRNPFELVHEWLGSRGDTASMTEAGKRFTARAALTQRGPHEGEPVIRFLKGGSDYARAYECCWGHYYSCNRTRIGMYCKALDGQMDSSYN